MYWYHYYPYFVYNRKSNLQGVLQTENDRYSTCLVTVSVLSQAFITAFTVIVLQSASINIRLLHSLIVLPEDTPSSQLPSHQPISLSVAARRYKCSASAWEIERVKAPWTTFQARAITESREKSERGRGVITQKNFTPTQPISSPASL